MYRKALKDNVHSSSLFMFAENLQRKDQHFDSLYDDYYTGGNLCVLRNKEYVVYAEGKNMHKLGE